MSDLAQFLLGGAVGGGIVLGVYLLANWIFSKIFDIKD